MADTGDILLLVDITCRYLPRNRFQLCLEQRAMAIWLLDLWPFVEGTAISERGLYRTLRLQLLPRVSSTVTRDTWRR